MKHKFAPGDRVRVAAEGLEGEVLGRAFGQPPVGGVREFYTIRWSNGKRAVVSVSALEVLTGEE